MAPASTASGSSVSKPTPGLPRQDYMLSYWLQHVRSSPLVGLRSTPNLPSHADCVVLGAGFSGVMTSYFLLKAPKSPFALKKNSLVLLEARELCHGATGRNGGHCRPDTYSFYGEWKKKYGAKIALELVELEADTLKLVAHLAQAEGIDCELWQGRCNEAFIDQAGVDEARFSYEEYLKDGAPYGNIAWHEGAEALEITRVKGTKACITYDAGQLYPFKLAEGLLQRCLDMGLNYQSTTTVTKVAPTEDGQWLVQSPRGSIKTKKVVYATNAWSAELLPELQGIIIPRREHCSSITPTAAFSGVNMMKRTQAVMYGSMAEMAAGQFGLNDNYIVQRPRGGTIIMGGCSTTDNDRMYNTDDSKTLPYTEKCLREYAGQTWIGWGEEKGGEGTQHVWTGILGMSPDNMPWVGAVPGRPGCYSNVGHSGHGMARIARTSQGLAQLILSGSDNFSQTGLPVPLEFSKKRMGGRAKL